MSLRGRHVIDRIKRRVSRYIKLPCPPYHNPVYWEGVYDKLESEDVYEWGGLTLEENLLQHDYTLRIQEGVASNQKNIGMTLSTTFGDAIRVQPGCKEEQKILLLGCGNSKLGEDMAEHGWRGPLLQVDVVSRVLETTAQRCSSYVEEGIMDFIEDDATQLSAMDDNSIAAVVDKGLIDALFCADQYQQVQQIMGSVHRTLVPGGIFCLFSFSQPEFILPHLLPPAPLMGKPLIWKDAQVRELDSILMYRFQKDDARKKQIVPRGMKKRSPKRRRQ